MKKSLKFEVELDENHLPVNIKMDASDGVANEGDIKALMISAWAESVLPSTLTSYFSSESKTKFASVRLSRTL